jgi:hypothetical protein
MSLFPSVSSLPASVPSARPLSLFSGPSPLPHSDSADHLDDTLDEAAMHSSHEAGYEGHMDDSDTEESKVEGAAGKQESKPQNGPPVAGTDASKKKLKKRLPPPAAVAVPSAGQQHALPQGLIYYDSAGQPIKMVLQHINGVVYAVPAEQTQERNRNAMQATTANLNRTQDGGAVSTDGAHSSSAAQTSISPKVRSVSLAERNGAGAADVPLVASVSAPSLVAQSNSGSSSETSPSLRALRRALPSSVAAVATPLPHPAAIPLMVVRDTQAPPTRKFSQAKAEAAANGAKRNTPAGAAIKQ